ncbi:hypothetical protein DKX38_004432 [Salix brachista]|uniref:Phosphatidic acid phosphatase type 2/haloperoxidase domain-containing protein n=1 Tax=Salix brachista TaxID=2182728 RepID=A0A5N5NBD7_9ROSI|nr:hypothetical protein DKX38_004432 [Salix brachista]
MSTPVSADHFSFPSGHSSRVSFVAALVFLYKEAIEVAAVEVREKGGVFGSWVGEEGKLVDVVVVGVCAWALVTAISRVLLGRHYFFDVFAGFCLGVIEGVFSFRVLRFEDLFSAVVGLGIGEIMIVDCQNCRNVTVKLSCKVRFPMKHLSTSNLVKIHIQGIIFSDAKPQNFKMMGANSLNTQNTEMCCWRMPFSQLSCGIVLSHFAQFIGPLALNMILDSL